MKQVWVINHYIQTPKTGTLTRHYTFAPHLEKRGYHATLFTASAIHNSDINMIEDGSLMREMNVDGRDFIYVKTASYAGNGMSRVKNMLDYYTNVKRVAKALVKQGKRPDIIYASSPQPLSCLAALQIAKKLKVPCVCEVRDLWPESIVKYQHKSPKNPAILALRRLEKHIYTHADAMVFTMSGVCNYMNSRGWSKSVPDEKCFNVNNGIELDVFDSNALNLVQKDDLLDDKSLFKIVYCGSIRRVNNLRYLIDAVRSAKERELSNACLIIYGRGNEEEELKEYCRSLGIDSYVFFRGYVSKEYVPSIMVRSDVNIICAMKTDLFAQTGISSNKSFEYLAAAKPILSNVCSYGDIIAESGSGFVCGESDIEPFADMLISISKMTPDELAKCHVSARHMAAKHDFSALTDKLLTAFDYAIEHHKETKHAD